MVPVIIAFVSIDVSKSRCGTLRHEYTSGYVYSKSSPPRHDKAEHELEGAYLCGNCKRLLQPAAPSKQECDLERQLNVQRIQQQIELEALQHEQKMNHLRTLLLS